MRITWLLEAVETPWQGVEVALGNANWLQQRGHHVTVVSRSAAPDWPRLDCALQTVRGFHPEDLPDGDVLVGTFWTTVPWARHAGPGKGVPVHFCHGYEGDAPENARLRDRIDAVYRLPGVHHVATSHRLARLLGERFGIRAHEVTYTTADPGRHAAQLEALLQRLVTAHLDQSALRLLPTPVAASPTSLDELGQQLRQLGLRWLHAEAPEPAARALLAAHCLLPHDGALVHAAASAQLAAGDAPVALALLDELAGRGVDDEALHVGRGRALHALGRLAESAQAFRAALAVGAHTADAYNRLGVVLFQAGDLRGARHSFERALELQPDHGDARANLTTLPAA